MSTQQRLSDAFSEIEAEGEATDPSVNWRDREPRTVTPPWRDRDYLDHLYNEKGHSMQEIADIYCNGAVVKETVRTYIHKYDLMPSGQDVPEGGSYHSLARRLELADKDDVCAPAPEGDDSYKKYTLQGRDDV